MEHETIDRNSPREQACELPMAWGELWIDQLYAGHRRTIVAAFDDFASLAVGQEQTASRRSMLFGWLATASDEEFAELSCSYLEQLLEDPEQSVDQISCLMMLLARARSDARRELAPELSPEHCQAKGSPPGSRAQSRLDTAPVGPNLGS